MGASPKGKSRAGRTSARGVQKPGRPPALRRLVLLRSCARSGLGLSPVSPLLLPLLFPPLPLEVCCACHSLSSRELLRFPPRTQLQAAPRGPTNLNTGSAFTSPSLSCFSLWPLRCLEEGLGSDAHLPT